MAESSGYHKISAARHPLTRGLTKVINEHRVLLYSRIGPGSHPCYWCGVLVTWQPGARTSKGALVVDHVDRDPTNNGPGNLVPCCQGCNKLNSARTVTDSEPSRRKSKGSRVRGETRTCAQCGNEFVTWGFRPDRGRYCSRPCLSLSQTTRMPRTCQGCGMLFTPGKQTSKCCSRACSGVARRAGKV